MYRDLKLYQRCYQKARRKVVRIEQEVNKEFDNLSENSSDVSLSDDSESDEMDLSVYNDNTEVDDDPYMDDDVDGQLSEDATSAVDDFFRKHNFQVG